MTWPYQIVHAPSLSFNHPLILMSNLVMNYPCLALLVQQTLKVELYIYSASGNPRTYSHTRWIEPWTQCIHSLISVSQSTNMPSLHLSDSHVGHSPHHPATGNCVAPSGLPTFMANHPGTLYPMCSLAASDFVTDEEVMCILTSVMISSIKRWQFKC